MATGGVVGMIPTETPNPPARYETYAQEQTDPQFTEWLRKRTEPTWTTATSHRFVREVGSETIAEEVFSQYLVQDYAFIGTLAGVIGHAIGDAPTMEAKSQLADFLTVLINDENDYFERSFAALDIDNSVYNNPPLTGTTKAFEDLLERAGREGGYGETLAVLVPAEWIYLSWASELSDDLPQLFYLAEWIDLHANEAFEAFVHWLRRELDRVGRHASTTRRHRLERLFQRTVELEVAFFDAAYKPNEGIHPSGGGELW